MITTNPVSWMARKLLPVGPQHKMGPVERRWSAWLRDHDAYYRLLYRFHRQLPEPRLAQIHLEPTNGCNLKCVTCNNAGAPYGRGRMPLALAKEIIDEAYEALGSEGILGLFIRGESVAHPSLPEMVRHARRRGFRKILLSSNIMLLDEDKSRALLEAGLSELRLSVDAVDAPTFEKLRCGARYTVIENNMAALARIRDALGSACRFRLHAALHRRGFERVPELVRRWHPMIHCFKMTVAVNQGGLFTQEQAASFSGLPFATSTGYQVPCRILYDYIGATYDGKLTSCCVDYREQFVVGKLSDGLVAGFDNEASRALRERHLRGDFGPLCGTCGFNNVLVDWFEFEVNDYVEENRTQLVSGAGDAAYARFLAASIDKFNRLASTPPPPRRRFDH